VEWTLEGLRDLVKNDGFSRAELCDAAMTCLMSSQERGEFVFRRRKLVLCDAREGRRRLEGVYQIQAVGRYVPGKFTVGRGKRKTAAADYGLHPIAYMASGRVYPVNDLWRILMNVASYRTPAPPGRDYAPLRPGEVARDKINPELGELLCQCRAAILCNMPRMAVLLEAASWQMVNRWERGLARIPEGIWPRLREILGNLAERGSRAAEYALSDMDAFGLPGAKPVMSEELQEFGRVREAAYQARLAKEQELDATEAAAPAAPTPPAAPVGFVPLPPGVRPGKVVPLSREAVAEAIAIAKKRQLAQYRSQDGGGVVDMEALRRRALEGPVPGEEEELEAVAGLEPEIPDGGMDAV